MTATKTILPNVSLKDDNKVNKKTNIRQKKEVSMWWYNSQNI